MIKDQYRINSSITLGRTGANQNIREFLILFNNFYDGIRMKTKPSFPYEMKDPYGFALMCEDYKDIGITYDMDLTCKEIFEGEGKRNHLDCITYHGQFSFREILDFLYIGFLFDYKKAIDVYKNQHNALSIFKQIINGQGFIFNRARPMLKKSLKASRVAVESIISLDEDLPIQKPHVWRLCDGMIPPFVVSKYHNDMQIKKAECHGFGEGIFILSDNKIIDCLKINDTWFTDLPLEHRLFFAHKCTEYEVDHYGKAWSLRSILDVGKMLGADSTNGLLVRSVKENFFHNRWFNWSKTSLVYCRKSNDKLFSSAKGNYKPDFYTLEGDLGLIHPIEERKHERVYLDDWDIKEFQKILELGD